MAVQHVEAGEWAASGELGAEYGANAARFVAEIGFPPGVNVWLDLESVSPSCSAADVVAYRNNWFDAVEGAGYTPGIYVGWQPVLSISQLYSALKFKRYWGAYNVDAVIPQRGWVKQTPAHTQVAGIDHDDNLTHGRPGRAGDLARSPRRRAGLNPVRSAPKPIRRGPRIPW